MKARNTLGTSMTQARDIACDLGLHIGAGDGDRTGTCQPEWGTVARYLL